MKFTKAFYTSFKNDPLSILESMNVEDIVSLIQNENHRYYTLGQPNISDDIYDLTKDFLKQKVPNHPILKHVGAFVDNNDQRKEKLPYFMSSLDKIKSDSASLSNFKARYQGTYMVSDKLDGNSALLYVKGKEVKLFSRGDGVFGQNISHLIPFIDGVPSLSTTHSTVLCVRGELIIPKHAFDQNLKNMGANARNTVAGLVNAKVPDLAVAKHVLFVAYSMYYPLYTPEIQFKTLLDLGFKVVFNEMFDEDSLTFQQLSDLLVKRRSNSDFEVDGLVVVHNAVHNIVSGKNPSYAFAFKHLITQETAEVVVSNVNWNVSKDGYIKPVVEFQAVRLNGVDIKRATGFNAEFIQTNKIGPGARILITRSGDVIPYILKVLVSASSGQLPSHMDYEWTASGKDIVVKNKDNSSEVGLKRLESFFDKLNIKGVGPASVKAIFDAGFTTIESVLALNEDKVASINGLKNKKQILKNLQDALLSIECITLMDASHAFGRGFGERKLRTIVNGIPAIMNNMYIPTLEELLNIDGVSTITAQQFLKGLQEYRKFYKQIQLKCHDTSKKKVVMNVSKTTNVSKVSKRSSVPNISNVPNILNVPNVQNVPKNSTSFQNEVIVFTGFRNKGWERLIEDNGGKVASSLSSKTTLLVSYNSININDPKLSSKIKQAIEKGIKIISKDEFERKFIKI